MFCRAGHKLYLASIFLFVTGSLLADTFGLKRLWTLPAGSRSYLTTAGDLERGLAYNPISRNLILVSRADSSTIRRVSLLSSKTGEDIGQLNTSGISGGTFVLSKIAAADDGVIYAANFGTYSSTRPFKLYRWSSETSVPSIAFSGNPATGTTEQWGNALDVRGSGKNTQVLLSSQGSIVSLLTTSNGTNFSATALTTDAPARAFYHGVAFGRGNTFWGKASSGELRLMEFDLITKVAKTLRTFGPDVVPSAVGPLAVDSAEGLLGALEIGTTEHIIHLYDVLDGMPALAQSVTVTNPFPNTLFQGAVDLYAGRHLFVLDANNGLHAFEISSLPARLEANHTVPELLRISWPGRWTNAILQSRILLHTNSTWTTRNWGSFYQNGSWFTPVPIAGSAEFYRLHRTLRTMTYNIHHGENTAGTLDLTAIAEVIRQAAPDLVGLQEVDRNNARSGFQDQAAELGRLTGMHHFFGKNFSPVFGAEYGLAVLSRHPIRKQTHRLYSRLNTSLEQRGINEVHIDVAGSEIILLNTHLDHTSDDTERLHQVSQLLALAKQFPAEKLLLCGDFNFQPASAPFNAMAAACVDAWPVATPRTGYTFPSTNPNRRIDFFWAMPGGLTPVRGSIPQSTASDHLPMMIDWLLPKDD